MIELLVLSTCLGDYACDKSLKAYYYERPNLIKFKKKTERKIVYYVGEWIVYAVPVAALAVNDKKYDVKITKNLSCNFNSEDVNLNMRWDF
jgi:hypothetical protein